MDKGSHMKRKLLICTVHMSSSNDMCVGGNNLLYFPIPSARILAVCRDNCIHLYFLLNFLESSGLSLLFCLRTALFCEIKTK